MLAVTWIHTEAADKYQIQRSSKPAMRDMSSTGTDTSRIRPNDVISGGMVLPIAWNMLEATKMMPDPMKFQAEMRRYSLPTATTSGSLEKNRINADGAKWQSAASATISPVAISTPDRNACRTRSPLC